MVCMIWEWPVSSWRILALISASAADWAAPGIWQKNETHKSRAAIDFIGVSSLGEPFIVIDCAKITIVRVFFALTLVSKSPYLSYYEMEESSRIIHLPWWGVLIPESVFQPGLRHRRR